MGILGGLGKGGGAARESQLIEASSEGKIDVVTKLLADGVSPNCHDADGLSPLHYAAHHGHLNVVTALVKAGANVNARAADGGTPLLGACIAPVEYESIVVSLLSRGADPNLAFASGPNEGIGPLLLAAFTGRSGTARALLAKNARIDARAPDGSTALHAAAANGERSLVALLMDAGADSTATDAQGLTPLHVAAGNGRLATAEELVARGAEVDARDSSQQTPLHRAAVWGSQEIAELLKAHGADVNAVGFEGLTALHGAAMKGHREVVRALLEAGADPHALSEAGQTPADCAAEDKAVRKLLKDALVAPPNAAVMAEFWEEVCSRLRAEDGDGLATLAKKKPHLAALTPEQKLFVAVGMGDTVKVRKLIDGGAKVGWVCADMRGFDALAIAAERGDVKVIRVLLEAGADINARRQDGGTALMDAALAGHLDAVKLLLKHNADVNARGNNNRTAVLVAANKGHQEVVDALVEAGASLDHVLANGLTCIGAALGYDHLDLARKLLALGANPGAKNADGFSLLPYHAVLKADVELLKTLASAGLTFDDPKLRDDILQATAERADPELVDFLRSVGVDAPDADIDRQDKNGYTPLISAVLANDHDRARKLLDAGANADLRDIDRETALSLAVDFNRKQFVEMLRERGAQKRDYTGMEPVPAMLKAASDGALGSILDLRDKGVSLNVTDAEGNTPLMLAAKGGHHGIVRALCRIGVLLNVRNQAKQSAYRLALAQDDKDIMRTLKEHSARDARDESGAIAWGVGDFLRGRASRPGKDAQPESEEEEGGDLASIFTRALAAAAKAKAAEAGEEEPEEEAPDPPEALVAAYNGDLSTLKQLAEAGADLEATYINGLTALQAAALKGNGQIVEFLAKSNVDLDRGDVSGAPALVSAIKAGNTEIVEQLLALGARADVVFQAKGEGEMIGGMTPLILAAEGGKAEICRLLLDHGASIKAMTDAGYTALMTSIQSDDDDTIRLMLAHGANPDPEIVQRTKNVAAFTPLTLAAARGQPQTAELLLERGVRVDSRDGNGWTALKHAARQGHTELINLLLTHHANVEAEDKEGWRPIHNLAAGDEPDGLKALLDAGADPNAQTKGENFGDLGFTPLMLAAANGASQAVDMLLSHGADVNVVTPAQKTVLCQALNFGQVNADVIRRLLEAGADATIGLAEDLPPLLLACARAEQTEDPEDVELVQMMLSRGADPDQEVDGSTILETANQWGNEALVALLTTRSRSVRD